MGLGKTLQTIAFLAFLREKGTYGPFLIVAPVSTLSNWVSEVNRFAPSIPVIMYHGTREERADLQKTVLSRKVDDRFPVVVTSYNLIMNDRNFLGRFSWKYIIIDEGHRIKNMNCKLIKELKTYSSANRLLLTGTPLQNNLAELWSLLNFLLPDIFHDLELFQSWFDFSALERKNGAQEIIDEENHHSIVSNLHAILKPFLLRRLKSDVELSLPPKREYILYAPLTPVQQEYYRHLIIGDIHKILTEKILESRGIKRKRRSTRDGEDVKSDFHRQKRRVARVEYDESDNADIEYFERLFDDAAAYAGADLDEDEATAKAERELVKASKAVNSKKLQNVIMQLRLACDSPHLFYSPWDDPESKSQGVDESLIEESGKMLLLDRLIPQLFKGDHKVLIFSQFSKMLDIIQDWAEILRGWKVCRLDGQVSQDDRKIEIENFNTDKSYKLFLLSTRAGGLGINLTAADTVILFDSDWNPQQDLQAMDRAHRIGQTKPVIVYRLATANTVEQTMLEKAGAKRQLEKLVIQKGKFKSLLGGIKGASADELAPLLLGDTDMEKFVVKGKGDVILSDEELSVLMDRSDEAYKKTQVSGAKNAAFKLVDSATIANNDLM
ncbi:P-loop containing nucleoside triphosphate hydrolase protein [Lipomyces japonicus]|uniref:P-loop containing nucleoside triphosphate hydrolase protein n=1 Tax=Lipomyces japonicus TaxID=56871 RepID=UPI0034CD1A2E